MRLSIDGEDRSVNQPRRAARAESKHPDQKLPMGFCYPGTGRSGDLPPRPECAPQWREKLLRRLRNLQLTLVIGEYAQAYHLPDASGSLTDRVQSWRDHWPDVVPLPHPSPRNNIWLRRNPWFEEELLPVLRTRVQEILESK